MTTKVTIAVAEGGSWDVLVIEKPLLADGSPGTDGSPIRVRQGESLDIHIHDGLGFAVTEVEFEETATDDAEDEGQDGSPVG